VPSIRFRLDDPSIEALAARVRSEYGENARILSAAEVRVGGIGGFFARRFVDVEIDLRGDTTAPTLQRNTGGAGGIESLLDAADRAERGENAPSVPSVPTVSTETGRFDQLMTELRSYVDEPTPMPALPRSAPPAMYDEAGGLILFVGLGDDSLVVARSLARTVRRSELRIGGRMIADDMARVEDRRSASAARARGVQNDSVTLLAWGLGMGITGVAASIEKIRPVVADQIWVVVDASRKPSDTANWVGMVRAAFPVQAIAVVHSVETATPDTVHGLGLPVGWSDTVG
jgi:hypothetical protein